ncbi:hypothetical protein Tco_0966726 [Tanacetum coccineum]
MSSATSDVTYTSVYTDSEPGRAFWGADYEGISEGGIPRVIVLGYDGLPLQPVAPPSPDFILGPENLQILPVPQDEDEREPMFIQAHDPNYVPEPIYPEYIPLEDDHEFPAEEQPLPPVDSPTAESPGYITESDPEEDPEEYEDDEAEDGPVDYPMDGGDDGDDDDGDSSRDDARDEDEDEEDEDDEEEEEHLAPADSTTVIPADEPVSPPEGTEPIVPPPSTDITIGARITIRPQTSISLPPEAEVERLLAMTTPSPSPPISLSPPSAGERLARCMAPPAHSPPLPPSSGCLTQIQTLRIASTQALIDAVTAALPPPPLPPLPPSLPIPSPVDRRDDIPESEQPPRKRLHLSTIRSRYEIGESSTARPVRGLNKLLNSQMSTRDKSGLGSSDVEDSPVHDRFANVKGMHAVPPPMIRNYMPLGLDRESNPSVETLESMPEPVVVEPKVVSQPKVWSDAPIIEEYNFSHLIRDCDFHEKRMAKQVELNKKKNKGTGQGENRPVWNNVQRLNHQNKFVPKADNPQRALKNKGIADHGCSRHMTGNKAYLIQYQDYNGGPVAFEGKGPNWLFDLDYLTDSMNYQPVRSENQANKTAGPEETNHSAGTQDTIDAGNSEIESEPAQKYFVLPVWSSYTSTVKRSEAKNGDVKPNRDTGPKTNEDPKDQEDQAFLEELERLKRQEKEANDAAEVFSANSTNIINTASTPISTASPSNVFSAGGPDLNNNDQDDSQIPALEDIYDNPSDEIFTNASYDDEGVVADFTNLETTVNVSPIPTSRIHSIHPTTQILRDPTSAVQTRSKVHKSSGAHAFVSYIQK